jgi:hypothetical protein
MKINLKQFGTTLSSRPAGKAAYAEFQSSLVKLGENEMLEIDFEGISSFSPSWGDEFLTPLLDQLGDRLILLKTKNMSVAATIEFLEEIGGGTFNRKT